MFSFLNKKNIQNDVFAIAFKLMIGVLLLSTIMFSLLQLAKFFQGWLGQFENGAMLEISIFSGFAFLSSIGLFFLFYKRKTCVEVVIAPTINSNDLQVLLINFAEGLIKGFDKKEEP